MRITAWFLAAALAAVATEAPATTLDQVRARQSVVCGVSGDSPVSAHREADGRWTGFHAEGCRAVAAAVLGDPGRVTFVTLSTQQRFSALKSGEVDLVNMPTTWTLTRDSALGLRFTQVLLIDGQGFLVPARLHVGEMRDLDGASVCVRSNTTSETNLRDTFARQKIRYTPVVLGDFETVAAAFAAGRCDAYSDDATRLAELRAFALGAPADYVILPERISKEPTGPMVRQDDEQWFDIVKWVFWAMVNAEEMGITAANIDGFRHAEQPSVRRLLGVSPGIGKGLGLDDAWAYRVVRRVGNYGEVYQRTIHATLGLDRGRNALWTKGGLLLAPPLQ